MGIEATNPINETKPLSKSDKKKQKEQEKLAKEAAAKNLVDGLNGNNTDSAKGLRKEFDAQLKKQFEDKTITKEEYEEAKDYLHSKEWKKGTQEKIDSESRTRVAAIVGESDGTSIHGVHNDVKAELKDQLKNGEITEQEYKNAKKYAKTGNFFSRFLGKKESESRVMFRTEAHRNEVEETKTEGPKFSKKLQAKMNAAGITSEEVYTIGDENGGAADGTINYSYKKKQPGEMDGIRAAFNENGNGITFSKRETNKIMKEAGYHVEKAVDFGKVARDAGRGALIGSPLSYVNVTQNTNVATGALVSASAGQSTKLIGIGPAVGATVGAIGSAYAQYTRVEDRAIPTDIPKGITTYTQYAKYLDDATTKRGATLGKDIAKFYRDDKDNLDLENMNADLKRAAGTEGSTITPLNYEEATGLLTDLASGKIKHEPKVEPRKDPEPENCTFYVTTEEKEETVTDPTNCYKVKHGDNWNAVVLGKYKPKTDADRKALIRYLKDAAFEDMKKNNKLPKDVKSSRDAFFPKVGAELCVPESITINGTVYTYNENGKVKAGALGGKGYAYHATNPFSRTSRYNEYGVNACDEQVVSGKRTEAEARAEFEKHKRQGVVYTEQK